MIPLLTALGLLIAFTTLVAIGWSVAKPGRSLWPPQRYTAATPFIIWIPTFSLFGIIIALGVLEWGTIGIPFAVRFLLGVPLIVMGNLGVWLEVSKFGIDQTGGAPGSLRTQGLYRYSRNPQYVSDIMIVVGWLILCASPSAMLVGSAAITVLIAAPFSEEKWLVSQYGDDYLAYMGRVRRFL
ncbi:isoprenylcysteine carboxylmethyltransferase family protein [Nereida sp. MMG025]|uniref:methyltransferase family protein n=1 Tax=Nereida sp. MMG025 TaxID=2909981 RepID=UPI001F416AAD|nr:methyltransferase [Nereida sp. MMG025]MCF6445198.1 DUF1295 domain-containing protein [Nereida sp. MMG025]